MVVSHFLSCVHAVFYIGVFVIVFPRVSCISYVMISTFQVVPAYFFQQRACTAVCTTCTIHTDGFFTLHYVDT